MVVNPGQEVHGMNYVLYIHYSISLLVEYRRLRLEAKKWEIVLKSGEKDATFFILGLLCLKNIQGYSSGHGKGFVKCFPRVPQAVGLYSLAALQLPCCPSKQGELSENIFQNLSHDLMNNPVG